MSRISLWGGLREEIGQERWLIDMFGVTFSWQGMVFIYSLRDEGITQICAKYHLISLLTNSLISFFACVCINGMCACVFTCLQMDVDVSTCAYSSSLNLL